MSFIFGQRSLSNLKGVHQDLVDVAKRAIEISEVDFGVIEGLRTPERQAELVHAGASQTKQSKHLIGHAIDVAAYVSGAVTWEWSYYPQIAAAMQEASRDLGVQIVWGGVWDRQLASLTDDLVAEVGHYRARRNGKAFIDAGHFELRFDTGMTI